jgi:hypothetical protein
MERAAGKVSLSRPVDVTAKRKRPRAKTFIGTSYPRVDIPAKVFGSQSVHPRSAARRHAVWLRGPSASLCRTSRIGVDLAAIRAMPGVVEVVQDGSFLGVVARREEQARPPPTRSSKTAKWDAGAPLFGGKASSITC